MDKRECACPDCHCEVQADGVVQKGLLYCCEACATGHSEGEHCVHEGCECAGGASE
ncbi:MULTISPECIES: metallothionein [unclassified Pseudomonas]|uniref:metallothionein n=1 Tax=unclassified Pseudomonas TaxID=196821 RepID=UPI0035C22D17